MGCTTRASALRLNKRCLFILQETEKEHIRKTTKVFLGDSQCLQNKQLTAKEMLKESCWWVTFLVLNDPSGAGNVSMTSQVRAQLLRGDILLGKPMMINQLRHETDKYIYCMIFDIFCTDSYDQYHTGSETFCKLMNLVDLVPRIQLTFEL